MKVVLLTITSSDIGLFVSIIFFVASILIGYFFGYVPRKKNEDHEKLKENLKSKIGELLTLYKDIQAFIEIEQYLIQEADTSKQKARQGYTISQKCEPQRVKKRILELEDQLKKL